MRGPATSCGREEDELGELSTRVRPTSANSQATSQFHKARLRQEFPLKLHGSQKGSKMKVEMSQVKPGSLD